ncbi:DUF3280 domain-containing protein [Hyphomicrobium sp. LHD-15]|uniref:DUF3280 domain-containing protein n=1 Tax=Hyphomicrobium sp. LHD-15 TaxID=3072142 RepID=UPI002810792F|nr:DUF3280 domain-containing protein [Hyphomicrobium sp. LHD-15]MDQ8700642.1 DUF3280 domain-containing protein [Hyphomicrobium sp. LHD-15]
MKLPSIATAAIFTLLGLVTIAMLPAHGEATEPHNTAFLGVHFQNDNEIYEPTSDGERSRIKRTGQMFMDRLTESTKYRFAKIDPKLLARIASGQAPGECGGCEIDYAKEVGTDWVAWINVQKVSNLILNMNVYIADVHANKMVFVKSVDIRNNSDEGWERAINYLLKHYLLPGVS